MKAEAATLALLLVASSLYGSDRAIDADVEKVLALAFAAIEERYPGIPVEALALRSEVEYHCWSTRPNERLLAREVEFRPCFANVKFALTASDTQFSFVDREGNCWVADGPQELHVALLAGESVRVDIKPEGGRSNHAIDCNEAFGNRMPARSEGTLDSDAYRVDAKKIVEVALEAAIAEYSDLPRGDLELGVPMFRVNCDPTLFGKDDSVQAHVEPCSAMVVFSPRSSIIEYRYVDADGRCNIMRGPENVRVRVGGSQDPDCARGGFSVTEELVVECTEAFDDAERWGSDWSDP